MQIKVKILPHAKDLDLPSYATAQSAGMDLVAAVTQTIVLHPSKPLLLPTGLCIELPVGYEMQIRPRSGLALKHAITVLNSPGTIDADYRGEIKILLINLGEQPYQIGRGERIAQGVISQYTQVKLIIADSLSDTIRDTGGFGSTG
jgi:dUTP pyrophosphatase